MATKTIKAQMKQRIDTKANWASKNPVLLLGELGLVSDDPNLYKVGDGTTAWNALPFRGFDGTLAQELGTSENAAISQKAVTEKLTELSQKVDELESQGGNAADEGLFNTLAEVVYEGKVYSKDHESAVESTGSIYGFIPANQAKVKGIKAVILQDSAVDLKGWFAVAVKGNNTDGWYGVRKSPMVWNAAKGRYDTDLTLNEDEMYGFMSETPNSGSLQKPYRATSEERLDYAITSYRSAGQILALSETTLTQNQNHTRDSYYYAIIPSTEVYTREEGVALESKVADKKDFPRYSGVNDTNAFSNGIVYTDTCSVELYYKATVLPTANLSLFGYVLDQMRVVIGKDGKLLGAGYEGNNVYKNLNTNYYIKSGDVCHIIMVYDYTQNMIFLYANGVLIGSTDTTGNNKVITNQFTTGNGHLGIARLYNKALSADEVAELYNYGRPLEKKMPIALQPSLIYNYMPVDLQQDKWVDSQNGGVYDMTFTSATLEEKPFVSDAEDFARLKAITNYDNVIASRKYCKFDVVQFTKRASHDCTFVGERIWSCDKPGDGGAIMSVNPDGTDGKRIIKTSFYDEKGLQLEMKSVDYARGMLLVGNGSATSWNDKDNYDHCAYIFYQPLEWETIGNNVTTAITFENCGAYTKVNLSALGAKTYAFWGAQDIIYVSCNLFNDIYMVQLGKGTYNLGSGDYTAADTDKYNGSYKVIKHWHQDGGLGEWAGHGGQFYGDSLYIATNDPSKCLVYKCILDDDGGLRFEELNFNVYVEDGTYKMYGQTKVDLKYSYIDGLCIKDGKLYAQILNVNAQQGGTNVIVADL